MASVTQVRILDSAVSILRSTDTFRKGVNPTILPSTKTLVIGKWYDRLGYLTLLCQPVYGKRNSESKSVAFRSKNDLVSKGVVKGLGDYIHE